MPVAYCKAIFRCQLACSREVAGLPEVGRIPQRLPKSLCYILVIAVKNPKTAQKILFPSLFGTTVEIFAVFITGFLIDNWQKTTFSRYTCGFSPPPPRILTVVLTVSGLLFTVYGTRVAFRQNRRSLKITAAALLIISLVAIMVSWVIIGLSQTCLDF